MRVCALLVLLFLGFGVLMGDVARTRLVASPASARSPLKLVLPATASTPKGFESSSSANEAPASEASEPPVEAETTPAPTETTTPKSQPSPSGGGSSSSQGTGEHQGGSSESTAGTPLKKLPPVKHVFVIMLSDQPYASAFGPSSSAPYLKGKLEHEGELLVHYDAVAHEELANEVALLSGQGPTAETEANCPNYAELAATGTGTDEQALGNGCVYPSSVQTLPGQLEAKHLSWRAYIEGVDEAGAQPGACAHPAVGAADPTAEQAASTGAYATFRNPFVYFRSIVDSAGCATHDVGLGALKADLSSPKRTPSFSYIAPDRCDDGNPTPCTPGAPAGMAQANAFLARVVPEITASKAYKESGLIVITVDEAPSTGAFADSSSCCGQPLFANAPAKTVAGTPKGGGSVGALLLSPYVKGASTSEEPFNHFSLLRTIEQLFGLGHIGYAALAAVKPFEPALFVSR